jgi:hypothetical protein
MNRIHLVATAGRLLLGLMLINGISCAKNYKTASEPDEVLVVHGEPMSLVSGTSLRATSNIPKNSLKLGDQYFVLPRTFVRESMQKTRRSWQQIKNDNAAGPSNKSSETGYVAQRLLNVREDGGALYLAGSYYKFLFQNNDGNLELSYIHANGSTYKSGDEFEPIHYSINKASGVFSILVRESNSDLTSFTFIPFNSPSLTFNEDGSQYIYLLGKGRPAAWKDRAGLPIAFCNPGETTFEDLSKSSVKTWNKVLNGRLAITLQTKKCPPFSDVNERGIYLIDVYMFTPLKHQTTAGVTLPVLDPTIGKIVDSDIFVMRSEIYDKQGAANYRSSAFYANIGPAKLRRTITHELGHLLGLHHNFDLPSIMNYDYQEDTLTKYDEDAIQHLYPVRN